MSLTRRIQALLDRLVPNRLVLDRLVSNRRPRARRRWQPLRSEVLIAQTETLEDRLLLTNISGAITSDTTFLDPLDPIQIVGDVTISNGATLTFGAGVTVTTNSPFSEILVGTATETGRLVADGTIFQTEAIFAAMGGGNITNSDIQRVFQVDGDSNSTLRFSGNTFQVGPLVQSEFASQLAGNTFAANSVIDVTGDIDVNTNWPLIPNVSAYRLTSQVRVHNAATLTIASGVNVQTTGGFFNFLSVSDDGLGGGLVATNVRFQVPVHLAASATGSITGSTVLDTFEVSGDGNSALTVSGNTFQVGPDLHAEFVPRMAANTFKPGTVIDVLPGDIDVSTTWPAITNVSAYRLTGQVRVRNAATLTLADTVEVRTDGNFIDKLWISDDGLGARLVANNVRLLTPVDLHASAAGSVTNSEVIETFKVNGDGNSALTVSGNSFQVAPAVHPEFLPRMSANTFTPGTVIDVLPGDIDVSTTWPVIPFVSAYRLTGRVQVRNGATLILADSVEVRTSDSFFNYLWVSNDASGAGLVANNVRLQTRVVLDSSARGSLTGSTVLNTLDIGGDSTSAMIVSGNRFQLAPSVQAEFVPRMAANTFAAGLVIDVYGNIDADTTWPVIANVVAYRLTGQVQVRNGATLTLADTVEVRTDGNFFNFLWVSSDGSGARLVANNVRLQTQVTLAASAAGSLTDSTVLNTFTIEGDSTSALTVTGNQFQVDPAVQSEFVPRLAANTFAPGRVVDVSGIIDADTTWPLIPNVNAYRLTSFVSVRGNAMLTLADGVEVRSNGGFSYLSIGDDGSAAGLTAEEVTFSLRLALDWRALVSVTRSNFALGTVEAIIAPPQIPNPKTIDLGGNWWGTTVTATINGKITDFFDSNTRPQILFSPVLPSWPPPPLPGITVAETLGSTAVSETGTTDTFTVVLKKQPTSDVVLNVFSQDTTEATVSPATLTFTAADWNVPKVVTVTGVDDALADGPVATAIRLVVDDANSDDTYDPLADVFISVQVADDDPPPEPEVAVLGNAVNIADGDSSPSTLDDTDFGSVDQGGTLITHTFTVRNDGTAPLTLSMPAVTGGGFTITEGLSSSLPVGASDTFTVQLNTATAGTKSGQVSFTTDDTDENPFNFSITGTVTVPVVPEVTVLGNNIGIPYADTTPSVLDGTNFGSIEQGGTPVSHTFTVRNEGNATLTLSTLTLPTGFALTEGLSTSLAAGTSDTFTVQLVTDFAGTWSGNVSIVTNDSDENPFLFRITGTITVPEVTVRGNGADITDGDGIPSTLDDTDFGHVTQGGTAVSRTFTVRNDGGATMTLGSLNVPTGFTVTEGLSASLAPGASDTFTVQLDTATVGIKGGEISFTTNDGDENPFNFTITGTVDVPPAPDVTVLGGGVNITDGDSTPATIDDTDFGNPQQGGSPVSRTFTVRNDGNDPLNLSGLSVPAGFTVTEGLSASLAPGASDTFTVQLETGADGIKSGDVSFTTDDPDEPLFNFAVTGTVEHVPSPEIVVLAGGVEIADGDTTPATTDGTDFGSVTQGGAEVSRTFTVRNDGDAALTLGTLSAPAGFSVIGLPPSLAAGDSAEFTVILGTAVAGTWSGEISLVTDDFNENPFNFSITGTVVAPLVTVAVSPTSAGEGGTTDLVYTFTRTEDVTNALTVQFTVGGTATLGDDYLASGADAFSATAGTVVFAAGSATATVTIDPQDDSTVEPGETVVLTVTAGVGYAVGSPAAATATITDDEVAGLTVTETGGATVVSEDFTSDTFTVVLDARPTGNVVVNVTSADTGEATVTPATLTFTPDNWNVAQPVTVTGANDLIDDGPQVTTVTVAVDDAASDDAFDGLSGIVPVQTDDNDLSLVGNIGNFVIPNTQNQVSAGLVTSGPNGPITYQTQIFNPLAIEAYRLRFQLGLRVEGHYHLNAYGLGEKWLQSNRGWVMILPNGELHTDTRTPSAANLLARLDGSFYVDPTRLTAPAAPPQDLEAYLLDLTLDLHFTGNNWFNFAHLQETWFEGRDGWYFITPAGQLFQGNGTLVAEFGSEYYFDPSRLYNAQAPTDAVEAYLVDRVLNLRFTGNFFFNERGLKEKWLLSDRRWHYITPDGRLYHGEGALVAVLDPSYYDDPARLYDAAGVLNNPFGGTASVTVAGQVANLVIDPADSFRGAMAVAVTAQESGQNAGPPRTQTVWVDVMDRPPSLSLLTDLSITNSETAVFDLPATDLDGEPVSYTAELIAPDQVAVAAYKFDRSRNVRFTGNDWRDFYGLGERWLQSDGGWLMILPNGEVHTPTRTPSVDSLLVALDGSYHANLARLYDATLPPRFRAAALDQALGVRFTGNLWEDFYGLGEKWVQSDRGWLIILPNGEVHTATRTPSAVTRLETLDPSYYADPSLLYDAIDLVADTAGTTVTVSGTQVTLDPADDYVGTLVLRVTAQDGLHLVEKIVLITVRASAGNSMTGSVGFQGAMISTDWDQTELEAVFVADGAEVFE